MHRDSCKRMIIIPTGSVQKLNSYILQPSCRGGMQCVITAHSAHIHGLLYTYIQRLLPTHPYVYSAYHHACTHTQHKVHSTYSYALPATYIRIAQSETLHTNDHLWLKRVASITTTAKRNFTRSQKIVSLKYSCDILGGWVHMI